MGGRDGKAGPVTGRGGKAGWFIISMAPVQRRTVWPSADGLVSAMVSACGRSRPPSGPSVPVRWFGSMPWIRAADRFLSISSSGLTRNKRSAKCLCISLRNRLPDS